MPAGASLRPLETPDLFELKVPELTLFSMWIRPVCTVTVTQEPGRLVLVSQGVDIRGSDELNQFGINEKVDLDVRCGPQGTRGARGRDPCQCLPWFDWCFSDDDRVSKGCECLPRLLWVATRTALATCTLPPAPGRCEFMWTDPEAQRGGNGHGNGKGRSGTPPLACNAHMRMWLDPPGPFAFLPRAGLKAAGDAALYGSLVSAQRDACLMDARYSTLSTVTFVMRCSALWMS